MKIKFTREIDTEEIYRNMMDSIFKQYRTPCYFITDKEILKTFENEWRKETHTEMCETLTLEETFSIMYEFKGYVKNNIFENNC